MRKIFFRPDAAPLLRYLIIASLLLLCAHTSARAQSTDLEFPTPVTRAEISGSIIARDLGDPRLTRHYYALTGTQGDLNITVESANLNGDVDLFTVGTLRPLAKVSMYANGSSTDRTTKTIFLRQRESLILRIEARSANDDPGRYRIQFSGSFEPLFAQAEQENVEPVVTSRPDKNSRRVNAAGARIAEEPQPIAGAQAPELIAPTRTVEESGAAKEEETSAAEPVRVEPPAPVKPKPARPARTRRNPPTRAKRNPPATKQPDAPATAPATASKMETETVPATPQPEPPVEPQPAASTRLIIETRDGLFVERNMSDVRSIKVEKGQLVVVTNDGKVVRQPMTNVLRMTIEPR